MKRPPTLAVAKEWVNAMNAHDERRMASLVTEDVVAEEVAEGIPVRGRGRLAKAYREVFQGYPDCTARLLNAVPGPAQVALEVAFKGTNRGRFRGTPATGKSIDLRIAYFLKFRGQKIRSVTEYYDAVTLLKQQGLM